MAAVAFALCANAVGAAQMPNDGAGGPDASALMAFYGVSLATSPAGATEDKAVWLAKVQGLIAQAPAWLQQNVLASQTKAEFAANLAILESMQKGTLESSASAVKAVAASAKVSAKGVIDPDLGSGPSDVVYTPLTPCRIMDSRIATGGGLSNPLGGNTVYSIPGFITTGSNWSVQGGSGTSDCGLNSTVGSNIYAVAIVITILNPTFDAFLAVGESATLATLLSNVALNYTNHQGLSTMYIVPQRVGNTIRFAMPAGLSANIIFDVVGYFAVSQATALECTQLQSAAGTNIGAGSTGSDVSPTCAAGFALTGGGCQGASTGLANVTNEPNGIGSQAWFCASQNTTGGAINLKANALCCRVPGR